MSNQETLQKHNTRLTQNNTDLNNILEIINNLPIQKEVKLQDKEVTPTKEVQIITSDEDYDGLNQVTVEPIPDEYIKPTGTLDITENGTYDVTDYANANVNVEGGGKYAPRYIYSSLFYQCPLTDLDYEVANLDVSNVTNFTNFFNNCSQITSLNLNHWNTSKVTTLYGAFSKCANLISLNISNWVTSNVTNMRSIFEDCKELVGIDLSNWETSNVTDMSYAFDTCTSLTSLDLSNWVTSNVTKTNMMFYRCEKLQKLDIRNFTFDKVTNSSMMFYLVPDNCLIIVKGETEKEWVLNVQSSLTNVKTVAEYEAS